MLTCLVALHSSRSLATAATERELCRAVLQKLTTFQPYNNNKLTIHYSPPTNLLPKIIINISALF
jgi:hypothetical protein